MTEGLKVSDDEIESYYEKNKSDYRVAESRDVRHILVAKKAPRRRPASPDRGRSGSPRGEEH